MGPLEPRTSTRACSTASTASSTSPEPASATSGGRRRTSARSSPPASTRRTPWPGAVAAADHPVRLVSGSAVGYYGDRGDEELTESSPPGAGFFTDVVLAWEAAARRPSMPGRRWPSSAAASCWLARAARWRRCCDSRGSVSAGPLGSGAAVLALDHAGRRGRRDPAPAGPAGESPGRSTSRARPARQREIAGAIGARPAPSRRASRRPRSAPPGARRVRRRDPRAASGSSGTSWRPAATRSSTPTSRPRPLARRLSTAP